MNMGSAPRSIVQKYCNQIWEHCLHLRILTAVLSNSPNSACTKGFLLVIFIDFRIDLTQPNPSSAGIP